MGAVEGEIVLVDDVTVFLEGGGLLVLGNDTEVQQGAVAFVELASETSNTILLG